LDAWIGAAPEDEAVAARLADALGRKGLNIARRPRHTTVGEIAAGLARSRRLLVCVSDSYLEQPAGRFELDFARHVLPGGDKAMVFAVVGDCTKPVPKARADLRAREDWDSGADRIAYWLGRDSTEESSEEEPQTPQQLVERAIACQRDDPYAIFRARLAAEALLRLPAGEARSGATTASLIEARLEHANAELSSALSRLRASDAFAVNEKGRIKGTKVRDVEQLIDAVRILARKPGVGSREIPTIASNYPERIQGIELPAGLLEKATLHSIEAVCGSELADYEVGELLELGPTWRRYRANLKGSNNPVFLTRNMKQRPAAQAPEAFGWRRFYGALRTAVLRNSSERSSGESASAASERWDRLFSDCCSNRPDSEVICATKDVFRTEEGIELISEFAEGNSLRELLSTGPLAMSDARWIFPIVAEAVDTAAELQKDDHLRRPRKPWPVPSPDYVLVTGGNQVRLLGYDILEPPRWDRLLNSWPPPPAAFYAAPEQFAGTAPNSASSQYSIAVMLYEALTGYRPYRCESVAELAHLIFTPYDGISSPDLDPAIFEDFRILQAADAFKKALSRDPRWRFGDCREFVTAALAPASPAPASFAPSILQAKPLLKPPNRRSRR
jgi:serine/threonine protein kinase